MEDNKNKFKYVGIRQKLLIFKNFLNNVGASNLFLMSVDDEIECWEKVKRMAIDGDARAQVVVGDMLLWGLYEEKDYEKAKKIIWMTKNRIISVYCDEWEGTFGEKDFIVDFGVGWFTGGLGGADRPGYVETYIRNIVQVRGFDYFGDEIFVTLTFKFPKQIR